PGPPILLSSTSIAVESPSRSASAIRSPARIVVERLSGGSGQYWLIRLNGGDRSSASKRTGSASASLPASTWAIAAAAIGRAAAAASGKPRSVFQYQVSVVAGSITPIA